MTTKKDDKSKVEKVKTEKTKAEKDTASGNEKAKKIASKLEKLGVMGSRKNPEETGSNKMMIFMMALIVAVPVSTIVAYIVMPQQLNEFLSSSSAVGSNGFNHFPGNQQAPVSPSARRFNQTQQPDWVVQRRAEMQKRHAEFQKRNANQPVANRGSSEYDQRMKDRQAKMEQRRADFEKQNAGNYAANRNPSEPPQWVKDQQALMQKEQEKYRQQWANRSTDMPYNRAQNQSAYMANPGMNTYQSNQAPANVYAHNPAPYYNGYVQPVNPYYYNNAPYPGSYNAPYGQPGYPLYR